MALNLFKSLKHNSVQQQEYTDLFRRHGAPMNTENVENINYGSNFSGFKLINFNIRGNSKFLEEFVEVEDCFAICEQKQVDDGNDNDDGINNNDDDGNDNNDGINNNDNDDNYDLNNNENVVMDQSDVLLLQQGYDKRDRVSTWYLTHQRDSTSDDLIYNEASRKKLVNGKIRYIGDVSEKQRKSKLFTYSAIHPISQERIVESFIVKSTSKMQDPAAAILHDISLALAGIGSWTSFTGNTKVRLAWYRCYLGPIMERPTIDCIQSVDQFGDIQSMLLGHHIIVDPFNTQWSPHLVQHTTVLQSGIIITPNTLNKLNINHKTMRAVPRLPTIDTMAPMDEMIDGEIGREALGDNNFMISLISIAVVPLSLVNKNFDQLIKTVGVASSLLIEGVPSGGKTTQTKFKNALFGINSNSSMLVANNWSSSCLTSLRDMLVGFGLTVDDIDHEKMHPSSNDTRSFWMNQASASVEFTISHGIRLGASSLTTAIANDADKAVDWTDEAVACRVELLHWINYIASLTPEQRRACLAKLEVFTKSLHHHVLKLLIVLNFDNYDKYLSEVLSLYEEITDAATLHSVLSFRCFEFKAIILLTIDYMQQNVIKFDASIIRPCLVNIWRYSFEKAKESHNDISTQSAKKKRKNNNNKQDPVLAEDHVFECILALIPFITRQIDYKQLLTDEEKTKYEEWMKQNAMNLTDIGGTQCYYILNNIARELLKFASKHNDIFKNVNLNHFWKHANEYKLLLCTGNRNQRKWKSTFYYVIIKNKVDAFKAKQNNNHNNKSEIDDDDEMKENDDDEIDDDSRIQQPPAPKRLRIDPLA